MNEHSDIVHALTAILSWTITVAACILIWVILPAGVILGALLLLCHLLGPVIGFLAAMVLSIAAGVLIQDVT